MSQWHRQSVGSGSMRHVFTRGAQCVPQPQPNTTQPHLSNTIWHMQIEPLFNRVAGMPNPRHPDATGATGCWVHIVFGQHLLQSTGAAFLTFQTRGGCHPPPTAAKATQPWWQCSHYGRNWGHIYYNQSENKTTVQQAAAVQ